MNILTRTHVGEVVQEIATMLKSRGYEPDVLPQVAASILVLYGCSILNENQDKPDAVTRLADMIRTQANHVIEGLYKYRELLESVRVGGE